MSTPENSPERRREPRFAVASGAMARANAPETDGHACLDWSRTGFRVAAKTPDGRDTLPAAGDAPFAFSLHIRAALGRISVRGSTRLRSI